MNKVSYKGYHSIVKYDVEAQVLYGKIEDIDDLVSFECNDTQKVQKEFEQTVDEYLELCKEVGKVPAKTYSGQFNVRISPALHRQAVIAANKNGQTLNAFVCEAIKDEVSTKSDIHEKSCS